MYDASGGRGANCSYTRNRESWFLYESARVRCAVALGAPVRVGSRWAGRGERTRRRLEPHDPRHDRRPAAAAAARLAGAVQAQAQAMLSAQAPQAMVGAHSRAFSGRARGCGQCQPCRQRLDCGAVPELRRERSARRGRLERVRAAAAAPVQDARVRWRQLHAQQPVPAAGTRLGTVHELRAQLIYYSDTALGLGVFSSYRNSPVTCNIIWTRVGGWSSSTCRLRPGRATIARRVPSSRRRRRRSRRSCTHRLHLHPLRRQCLLGV